MPYFPLSTRLETPLNVIASFNIHIESINDYIINYIINALKSSYPLSSQLDWSWDVVKGNMVVVVRKYESHTIAPDLQEGRENLGREELDLEQQEAHGKKPR